MLAKAHADAITPVQVAPGVFRLRLGTPEAISPIAVRRSRPAPALESMAVPGEAPLPWSAITFRTDARGCVITLPYHRDEGILGLGLQLGSTLHSGTKKTLRVNADPTLDLGDSHAPVPFYLSTAGYAVLVDTARYASFWFGTHAPVRPGLQEVRERVAAKWGPPSDSTDALYRSGSIDDRAVIQVPAAEGVDLYVFAGPTTAEALRRYVLFSGGGCLPPLDALGTWYRCYTGFSQAEVAAAAAGLRAEDMPIDVIGLEPGWQEGYYPNTFTWARERFPDPKALLGELHAAGFQVNLWENPFVHPAAPMAGALAGHCGDETSTDGLAPDFLDPVAYDAFRDHHRDLAEAGVDGFKLDECDNGDYVSPWSFPEHTRFPSGADGEQMHSLLGVHYQHCIDDAMTAGGIRHFGLVRSSGALAPSLPFVLYSDLYQHRAFLRGMASAGASGLLWTPEVRHADSVEDLVRRVQSTVLSPLSLINAWYIRQPPWHHIARESNHRGERMEGWEAARDLVRGALLLRERLRPVLSTAFAAYHHAGRPPFRPLAVDYPEDPATWAIEDQWMIGEDLVAAPLVAGQVSRTVLLPPGRWYDLTTGARFAAGVHEVAPALGHVPLYVREGALLPLARPGRPHRPGEARDVDLVAFGPGPCRGRLWVDDGRSVEAPGCWLDLRWDPAYGLGPVGDAGPRWRIGPSVMTVGTDHP